MKLTKTSIIYILLIVGALISVVYVYTAINSCTVESSSEEMLKHTCGSDIYYTLK